MIRNLSFAIAIGAALSGSAFAQQAGDPVSVDPDVHHVILDNPYVRVFDARASVGARSPMHSHPPTVLISLDTTRLRTTSADGKTDIVDLNPGQVQWMEGVQHSWQLLAGELHAIGVEIKSAQKEDAPPAPTAEQRQGDAVSVDPDTHHVIMENPHVRVFEGRLSHGASSPMHRHPPFLLVSLDWVRLKVNLPDGTNNIFDLSPGMVVWLGEGATHSWKALAGDGRVIAIEVKSAQADMKP